MDLQELARVPRMVSGIGASARIAELAGELAGPQARVLLVADPGLVATGIVGQIERHLAQAGFHAALFSAFTSDPSLVQTDAAASMARSDKSALVIALGGGSAIDLGKAVAAIAGAQRPALAYEMCKRAFPKFRLPCICIPTTSGTGAEATRTSVLSRADKAKIWLWGEAIKPDTIVLDPELTVSLPAGLTAATGIDALVHAVEAATNRRAHGANNLYAHEAIRLVAGNLETAVRQPGHLAARAALQRAAALAGMAIDNCGTAIAHNIGHAMASLRPIHHGRAVGFAMLATLPWNVAQDDGAFAACAVAMGGTASAADFVAQFQRLMSSVGLDGGPGASFADIGAERLVQQMEAPENLPMLNSNKRTASPQDRLELARRVLEMA